MDAARENARPEAFEFSSSVEDDVWHPRKESKSYEWWYFDALSDDASEALIITFLDNNVYSRRYNSGSKASTQSERFPAVFFTYFSNGRVVYRSVQEFRENAFDSSEEEPKCSIGESSFMLDSAEYGFGYLLAIKTALPSGRRLEATLEWLIIESDFTPGQSRLRTPGHFLNVVAPRADVTGRITIFDRQANVVDERHFRGTGYHDHCLDNRWLQKTVQDWHWGRAHFADATAVFYRYREVGEQSPSTKLYLVKDGRLTDRAVDYEEQNYARNRYGLRYPTRLRLISDDGVRLRVKPYMVLDASFHYLRFLSEVTLALRDGIPRKTTGITEILMPRTLRYRWLNWLHDARTGKDGKPPLLR